MILNWVLLFKWNIMICLKIKMFVHILGYSNTMIGYASVTSNHGPRTFFAPVLFLARKAEWSARRNFTLVLFSWSYQALGPVRFDTAVHLWFGRIIRRTPHGPCAMPVRASCWPRMKLSNVFHIPRDPYGACKGAVRHPYRHVRELT